MAGRLAAPHLLGIWVRAFQLHALVRLGDTEWADQALAGLSEHDRGRGQIRIATAALRLAQDDPRAAVAALAPVLDGSAPVNWRTGVVQAFLLEAIARDTLGDPAAAERAVERALDLAEPDGALSAFLLHPAPGLLERHVRHHTAHAALLSQIPNLLAGRTAASPPAAGAWQLLEPLTKSEVRVLRYLPTNLSAREIARELSVSVTTVRTHISHLFAKLDAHRRTEAVARARDLGLLTASTHGPSGVGAGLRSSAFKDDQPVLVIADLTM
ncbi:MAG TPA: LuxR C-terminal-related transcriptional regulator [Streptosporangiaceae bacterium]